MNTLQKSEENVHCIYYFYNIEHRETYLVCMCRSTTSLFKIAMLPNIWVIWLPCQLYVGLTFWGENEEKSISLFHFYNIYHRKPNLVCMLWCICVHLHLPSSKNPIITTIRLKLLPWQPFLLHWNCATPKYYIYKNIEGVHFFSYLKIRSFFFLDCPTPQHTLGLLCHRTSDLFSPS